LKARRAEKETREPCIDLSERKYVLDATRREGIADCEARAEEQTTWADRVVWFGLQADEYPRAAQAESRHLKRTEKVK